MEATTRARRVAAALATFAALAAAAPAGAGAAVDDPAPVRFAPGTPNMAAAQQIARDHWGVDPCGGAIEVAWSPDEPTVNARATWRNPRSAYDAPAENSQCSIAFNPAQSFDWPKFCTVLVHEYGHLAGHDHVQDRADLMAGYYVRPIPACAATPAPDAPVVAAPAQQLVPAARAASPRRAASRQSRRS